MPRTKNNSSAKKQAEKKEVSPTTKEQAENKDNSPVAKEQQEEKKNALLEYDINIYPSKAEGTLKASANVNINGQFAVRGIKVMEGVNGLFVSMPSFRTGNGEYKDICFPCTKESKADFDRNILEAYKQKMEQSQNNSIQQNDSEHQQNEQPAMNGM